MRIRRIFKHVQVLGPVVALFALAPLHSVLAQNERSDCPDVGPGAKPEEHALCWFNRAEKLASECAASTRNIDLCALQASYWCADASLNEARVANTCFLACIRNRQFEEALSLQRYLQKSSGQIAKCQKALTEAVVNVTTHPAGAEIFVDGRPVGIAPTVLTLQERWWNSNITVRFGAGQEAKEVNIYPDKLSSLFTPQDCTLGDLTVDSPPVEQSALSPISVASSEPKTPTDSDAGISLPGVVITSVGAAAVVTGSILIAIAGSTSSELTSVENGTYWTNHRQEKFDSVKPMRIGGGIALGVGAALTTAGVVLIVKGFSGERSNDRARLSLRLSAQGVHGAGNF